MPSSKKRKDTAQGATLHDYFGARSKKTRTQGYSAPPRTETRRVIPPTLDSREIIVIADEEDFEHMKAVEDVIEDVNMPDTLFKVVETPPEEPDVKNLQDDYWAMGDDENVIEHEDDILVDEEKAPIELCQGSYQETTSVCPVCNKPLQGLSIDDIGRHVNLCLDALSLGSASSERISGTDIVSERRKEETIVSSSSKPDSVKNSTTAFSVLMSGHKEADAWKEATEAENMKGNVKGRRPAPFYKVMTGMPVAVDAFRYGKIPGVTSYFLTHAHSDHYTNLSSSWKNGPIYCSQTTANLIIHMLNVDPKWVVPLPMNTPIPVPDSGGVTVTLIQANHCPGSVLFLFEGPQTVNAGDSTYKSPFIGSSRVFRYLHCGDFRACPQHVLHSEIKGKKVDTVYLDTTYLDPKYCFPPQPLVISACAELARRIVAEGRPPDPSGQPRNNSLSTWISRSEDGKEKGKENEASHADKVLVIVGTYTIGKERIVKAIANALSTKVYCDARKTAVLKCQSDTDLHDLLTNDPLQAGVHVVPLHIINSDRIDEYLSRWKGTWTKAVGFRPTGWTYTGPNSSDPIPSISNIIVRDQARTFTYANLRPMKNSTPRTMLYGVPYSEHSSFFELTCFALSLDWGKMIATVNVGNPRSRARMERWFEKWQTERAKRTKTGHTQEVLPFRGPDHW